MCCLIELPYYSAEYRVVIVCSNQNEDKSHIISKLEMYRKQFVMPKNESFRDFLRHHFTISEDGVEYQHGVLLINASVVDPDKYVSSLLILTCVHNTPNNVEV